VHNKPFIFITGAPRSGTSLVTKVIGAHSDIAMVMENIFENRKRHWSQAAFWNDINTLKKQVFSFYGQFDESIIGNKVCTPDVWSEDDIIRFCSIFNTVKIIFVVRDPRAVVVSRYKREDYSKVYNEAAKENMVLDFSNRSRTYLSSWIISLRTYYKLCETFPNDVSLVYYDDLVKEPDNQIRRLFKNINVEYRNEISNWYKIPHYNAIGKKVTDLKYPDQKIFIKKIEEDELPSDYQLTKDEEKMQELFYNRSL
jgi:hypothetical protein